MISVQVRYTNQKLPDIRCSRVPMILKTCSACRNTSKKYNLFCQNAENFRKSCICEHFGTFFFENPWFRKICWTPPPPIHQKKSRKPPIVFEKYQHQFEKHVCNALIVWHRTRNGQHLECWPGHKTLGKFDTLEWPRCFNIFEINCCRDFLRSAFAILCENTCFREVARESGQDFPSQYFEMEQKTGRRPYWPEIGIGNYWIDKVVP